MDALTWGEKVKERDGNKCVNCGSTENLQAHHIKPKFLYPECATDVDNGITLCKRCHKKQHGGNFTGVGFLPANGINPDPEGRLKQYVEDRISRELKRREVYTVWGSNKENGPLLYMAAEAAGQTPKQYIAEAVSMRIAADGFEHDEKIFLEK